METGSEHYDHYQMETGLFDDELGASFDFNFNFDEDGLIDNQNMQAPQNQLNETVENFNFDEDGLTINHNMQAPQNQLNETVGNFNFDEDGLNQLNEIVGNFNFDEDGFTNNHNMQAPRNQLNETVGNFTNEELVELGLLCGSNPPLLNQENSMQNLTAPTYTNSTLLDPSLENSPNLALPGTSSFNYALVETPQSDLPIPEFWKLKYANGGNNQPGLERMSANPNLSGHVGVNHESTDPSLVNAPNLSCIGTSSANTPSIGAPQLNLPPMNELLGNSSNPLQPSNSLEQVEIGSSIGSNHSFVNNSSSSPNLMQSMYLGFEGSNHPLGNATTVQQTRSSFMNPPLPRTSNFYPPTTVNLISQNGVAQSFHPEHAADLINLNQLNPHFENGLFAQNLMPQRMASFNQGTPLSTDQIIQNRTNNNFSNNQQALPYTNSFPLPYTNSFSQSSMGVLNGRSSQINQQRSPRFSHYRSSPYRPLTQGSQLNQFISANVYGPQITNSVPSEPLRPQQLANQLQPLSQVPEMPNLIDPKYHYAMQPEFSMHPRSRQFTYQPNHIPEAPNVYDPLGYNTMLPEPSTWTPRLPHYNQLNQVPAAPDALDIQFNNSMQPKASMLSRLQQIDSQRLPNIFPPQYSSSMPSEPLMLSGTQQLSGQGQFNQVPMMPNHINLQSDNVMLPAPSMPLRPQTAQGLLNQTAISNASYPSPVLSQPSQVLNSLTQKEIMGHNTGVGVSHLLESSSSYPKQGFLGRHPRSMSQYELGELSMSSKRSRRESIMQPKASSSRQVKGKSKEDETENTGDFNPFDLRPVKNSVYDPIFEGIGLPVDPHLRMFSMS